MVMGASDTIIPGPALFNFRSSHQLTGPSRPVALRRLPFSGQLIGVIQKLTYRLPACIGFYVIMNTLQKAMVHGVFN